jgi:hypothetical protein
MVCSIGLWKAVETAVCSVASSVPRTKPAFGILDIIRVFLEALLTEVELESTED